MNKEGPSVSPLALSAWQARAQAFDAARGWDQVAPEHTLLHLVEEVGEIARSFLQGLRYKDVPTDSSTLGEELADLLMLLLKFASSQGISLELELHALFERLQKRFPEDEGRRAMARYLEWGGAERAHSKEKE